MENAPVSSVVAATPGVTSTGPKLMEVSCWFLGKPYPLTVTLSPAEPKVGETVTMAIPMSIKPEDGVTSRVKSAHTSSAGEFRLLDLMDIG